MDKQQQDTTIRLTSYVPPTTTWHKGFREHTGGYFVAEDGGIVTSQKLSEARAELYNAAFQFLHKQGYR